MDGKGVVGWKDKATAGACDARGNSNGWGLDWTLGRGLASDSLDVMDSAADLHGVGVRRHGGQMKAEMHHCGELHLHAHDRKENGPGAGAEAGVGGEDAPLGGRVVPRVLFTTRAPAAIAAGSFIGDPGGVWGVRSGKLRGIPEHGVPPVRLSTGMRPTRFCVGASNGPGAAATPLKGCEPARGTTKRALLAALEDSQGGGTVLPATVYGWLPDGEMTTSDLRNVLGWSREEAARVGTVISG